VNPERDHTKGGKVKAILLEDDGIKYIEKGNSVYVAAIRVGTHRDDIEFWTFIADGDTNAGIMAEAVGECVFLDRLTNLLELMKASKDFNSPVVDKRNFLRM
jgi:hypothetical protein